MVDLCSVRLSRCSWSVMRHLGLNQSAMIIARGRCILVKGILTMTQHEMLAGVSDGSKGDIG